MTEERDELDDAKDAAAQLLSRTLYCDMRKSVPKGWVIYEERQKALFPLFGPAPRGDVLIWLRGVKDGLSLKKGE